MQSDALISDCGRYRYWLTRVWGPGARALFVMLNPSTANAQDDDPTIRKCCGFAERWGLSGIGVVNLFAYRATKPTDLWSAALAQGLAEIVGPDCDEHMRKMLDDRATYPVVVAAWGGQAERRGIFGFGGDARVRQVASLLQLSFNAQCLGRTNGGSPRHPLMLPYSTPLAQYRTPPKVF